MAELAQQAIDDKSGAEFELVITNCDRSVGARTSGAIAKVHGNLGMSDKLSALTLPVMQGKVLVCGMPVVRSFT